MALCSFETCSFNEHLLHTVSLSCLGGNYLLLNPKINYIAINWQFTHWGKMLTLVLIWFPVERWMAPRASAKICSVPEGQAADCLPAHLNTEFSTGWSQVCSHWISFQLVRWHRGRKMTLDNYTQSHTCHPSLYGFFCRSKWKFVWHFPIL